MLLDPTAFRWKLLVYVRNPSFLSTVVADRKEVARYLWIQVDQVINSNHLNACLGGCLPTCLLEPTVSC